MNKSIIRGLKLMLDRWLDKLSQKARLRGIVLIIPAHPCFLSPNSFLSYKLLHSTYTERTSNNKTN